MPNGMVGKVVRPRMMQEGGFGDIGWGGVMGGEVRDVGNGGMWIGMSVEAFCDDYGGTHRAAGMAAQRACSGRVCFGEAARSRSTRTRSLIPATAPEPVPPSPITWHLNPLLPA